MNRYAFRLFRGPLRDLQLHRSFDSSPGIRPAASGLKTYVYVDSLKILYYDIYQASIFESALSLRKVRESGQILMSIDKSEGLVFEFSSCSS